MTLEDKLVEKLIAIYAQNGINVHKVLDNPEFANLSLDKKIQFIEKNKEALSATPKFDNRYLKGGALGGVVGLAGSMYVNQLVQGRGSNPISLAVGLGAAGGAGLGAISGYFAGRKDQARDEGTRGFIQNNDYLGALGVRNINGMGQPISGAGPNKYVEQVKGFAERLLGDFGPRFENNLREALAARHGNGRVEADNL